MSAVIPHALGHASPIQNAAPKAYGDIIAGNGSEEKRNERLNSIIKMDRQ
jgi:hypothetical protein